MTASSDINENLILDEKSSKDSDDELLVLINEAVARLNSIDISGSHPWENYYNQKYPKGDNNKNNNNLLKNVTLDHIQLFRNSSGNTWWNEKRCVNESRSRRRTIETSIIIPSGPFALYSVISKMTDCMQLTPIYNEVVANDRFDLRIIELNENSKDILNYGNVVNKDHPIGDIICVTKLQQKKDNGSICFDEISFEDIKNGKLFWEVSEFFVLPRDIFENVITTPYTKDQHNFLCVGSNFVQVISLPKKIAPKETNIDTLLMTSIFVPRTTHGQFLKLLKSDYREEVVNLWPEPLLMDEPTPIVIKARLAPDYVKNRFDNFDSAFKHSTRDAAYQTLKIVVQHGSIGIHSIKNQKNDFAKYKTTIKKYEISKPYIYFTFLLAGDKTAPPIEKWNRSARIKISNGEDTVAADILSVKQSDLILEVKARSFLHSTVEIIFKKFEGKSLTVCQKPDFKPRIVNYEIEEGTNADRLIQAIYGGKPLKLPKIEPIPPIKFGNFVLLERQTRYVQLMADERICALIGSSSFGCGKTATIAAAALYSSNINPKSFQIVTAITNSAVVALVEKIEQLDSNASVVRIISQNNMLEVHPDVLTKFDYPKMLEDLLVECLKKETESSDYFFKHAFAYLKSRSIVPDMTCFSKAIRNIYESADEYDESFLLTLFMREKQPKIIVGTVQSIINAFYGTWADYSKDVCTIQIDESSTLPRESLLHVAFCFPKARMSFVGDHRQLEPFCERESSPLLRNTAVGNFLEDCQNLLPSVFLNRVFRCRPEVTKILGDLFYNSSLVSEHRKAETEDRLKKVEVLQKYPIIFIDTKKSSQEQVGTTLKNIKEAKMAKELAEKLLKYIKKTDIAILCFYKGQLNEFYDWSRKTGIYVGSVDSGQGREWPVCIICTTRTTSMKNCQFMIDNRRVNVALSRSRHLNFIFGHKSSMDNAKNWKTIIQKCKEKSTIFDSTHFL